MKVIGVIGGTTWHSSMDYYRMINEEVNRRLGGVHSARMILYSLEFGEFSELQHSGRQSQVEEIIVKAGKTLERAGADLILLAANATHMFAEAFEKQVSVPLIHIVDVTAEEIHRRGLKTVGLLGARFTMKMDFYKARLKRHRIECLVPFDGEIDRIHEIIFKELARGEMREDSRRFLLDVIEGLKKQGAQAVILGCTEFPMILDQSQAGVPLLNTAELHAVAAARRSLD